MKSDIKSLIRSTLGFFAITLCEPVNAAAQSDHVDGMWADRAEDCGTPFRLWVTPEKIAGEGLICHFVNGDQRDPSAWTMNAKCYDPSEDSSVSNAKEQQLDITVNGSVLSIYFHSDNETIRYAIKCKE